MSHLSSDRHSVTYQRHLSSKHDVYRVFRLKQLYICVNQCGIDSCADVFSKSQRARPPAPAPRQTCGPALIAHVSTGAWYEGGDGARGSRSLREDTHLGACDYHWWQTSGMLSLGEDALSWALARSEQSGMKWWQLVFVASVTHAGPGVLPRSRIFDPAWIHVIQGERRRIDGGRCAPARSFVLRLS